jgi:hypothetical protein
MHRPDFTRPAVIGSAVVLMAVSAIAQAPPDKPATGIYLEVPGKTGDDGRVKLQAVIVQEVKQTGMLKMIASQGLLGGGVVEGIGGTRASVRAAAGDVTFDFYLDPQAYARSKQPMSMDEAMKMMSGDSMPIVAQSADEFVLLHLTPKDNTRQAQVGTSGRSGKMGKSKDAVPFSIEKLGEGVFRVRPKEPLPPGEYAFMISTEGRSGEFWDFGVDGK